MNNQAKFSKALLGVWARVFALCLMILGAFVLPPHLARAQSLPPAGGTTLWVDASNGWDGNDGSSGAPLQSVQNAVDRIGNGQGGTILLRSGYYAPFRINGDHDGSSNAWLVIRAEDGASVTISPGGKRAFGDYYNRNDNLETIYTENANYLAFANLNVNNADRGFFIRNATGVRVFNCRINDIWSDGIRVDAYEDGGTRDIVLDNNDVWDVNQVNRSQGNSGIWGACIVASRAVDVTMTNNRVRESWGEGLGISRTDTYRVINNRVWDIFASYVYPDGSQRGTIERNFIYSTGNRAYFRNLTSLGFEPEFGLHVSDEDPNNALNGGDLTFKNNILVGTSGIGIDRNSNWGTPVNVRVFNNTIYDIRAYRAVTPVLNFNPGIQSSGIEFYNNIFYQDQVDPNRSMTNAVETSSGLSFAYNLWYGGNPGPAVGNPSFSGNPLFVNPGGLNPEDYRLRAGSPALNVGATWLGVDNDFFGSGRPQGGGLDLGAIESAESGGSTGGGGSSTGFYRIRCRWSYNGANDYLYDGGEFARYSASPSSSDTLYQWEVVTTDSGHARFRNRSTGDVLNIENIAQGNDDGNLRCTAGDNGGDGRGGWYSSRWVREPTDSGYERFQSAWQGSQYIHIENRRESAQYGFLGDLGWHSAQWTLEPVSSDPSNLSAQ